jgi:hypothetical protein
MQQKEKKTQETAKQVYEKPQLGRIALVADHVLTCYGTTPCNDNPYGPSST